MRRQASAAQHARQLLHTAAQRLHTASPVALDDMNRILEASLPLPPGDPAYAKRRLLEPNFSETADSLAFVLETGGPGATPTDQVESSTQAMRRMVGNQFGREALRWLDGRIEPARGLSQRAMTWGAMFGSGFDRNGVMEALVTYEWGPGLMDSLPGSLYEMARLAVNMLPGLRPALTTVRCGRSSGSQQLTFDVDQALALSALRPLMDALGLGHQHTSLMSSCAFLLGARFTLPPNTALLTLRPTRVGVELRLDVNLDALRDVPPQLVSLMRLQMAERPRSLRALDRWVSAMTLDGYDGPGDVSLLSVWVRPDMPARIALYLRPAALEAAGAPEPVENGATNNGVA